MVAAVLAASACSLTSLSGFSGGDDGDAGDATGVPPSSEAGGDIATPPPPTPPPIGEPPPVPTDGAPPPDASKDGPFCSAQPNTVVLCDDFERPTASLVGPWTKSASYLGTIELLADGGTHGTYAHAAIDHLTANPTGNDILAYLERDITGPVSDFESRFRLAVDALPTEGYIHLMNLTYVNADGTYTSVYLLATSTAIGLYEQWFPTGSSPPATHHDFSAPLTTGVWHDVKLHVRSAAPQHATVTVDGAVVVDTALATTLVPAALHAYAGIRYSKIPTGPLSVRLDDVALDVLE